MYGRMLSTETVVCVTMRFVARTAELRKGHGFIEIFCLVQCSLKTDPFKIGEHLLGYAFDAGDVRVLVSIPHESVGSADNV